MRVGIGVAAPPATSPAAFPASGASTKPATAPAEKSSRDALVAEAAGLPRRPEGPVAAVVGLVVGSAVDDGFLHAHWADEPAGDDAGYATTFAGWPGFVVVDRHASRAAAGAGGAVMLRHHALREGDTVESITTLITRDGYLQLNRDTETPALVRSVTLLQTALAAGEDGSPVVLIVDETRKDDRPSPPTRRVTADTFVGLCRDEPALTRDALLPILRDLGAAGVLRFGDAGVAWQVLGPRVPRDPATVARVDALLARLDADDFAARAKAEDDLVALGGRGAAELRRRDVAALPPDVRGVAETVIRRAEPLTAARAAALGGDASFLLDGLTLDDAALVTAAAARLAEITGRPVDVPATLPVAERTRRADALRTTLVPTTAPADAR